VSGLFTRMIVIPPTIIDLDGDDTEDDDGGGS